MDDVLKRVRREFLEMPGLTLTPQQLQRLCGLESAVMQRILDTLVDTDFLYVSGGGQYVRRQASGRLLRSSIQGAVATTPQVVESR